MNEQNENTTNWLVHSHIFTQSVASRRRGDLNKAKLKYHRNECAAKPLTFKSNKNN